MYEFSKNPSFCFEGIIRIAFRAFNSKIDLNEENRFVYVLNYLFDMYYEQDINNLLDEQVIPKINYQYYQ